MKKLMMPVATTAIISAAGLQAADYYVGPKGDDSDFVDRGAENPS